MMGWYHNRSVKTKLIATLGLVMLLAFGALIGTNVIQLYNVSIANGEYAAREEAMKGAAGFEKQLNAYSSSLHTLEQLLIDASKEQLLSREDAVQILTAELLRHPHAQGIFTIWEPNTFDGQDAANKNNQGYGDESGRFSPFITRSGDTVAVAPLSGYETEGSGDYYLIPKSTKQPYWGEPFPFSINGAEKVMTSIVLPILDEQETFQGIIGIMLSLEQLQQTAIELDPFGGFTSIISSDGMMVANGRYPDEIMTHYGEHSEERSLIWSSVQQGDLTHYSLDRSGAEVIRLFTPVFIDEVENPWMLSTVINRSVILEGFYNELTNSIIIAVVALLLLAALLYFSIQSIVKQLRAVNAMSQRLSEGDFTNKLTVKHRDEFGLMAGHLNDMIENLRQTVRKVSEHSLSVGATSEQLMASAEQTSQAAETIASSIQEVASGAETQRQNAQESSRAMTEMAVGIQRIAESASSVSDSTSAVSGKTREGHSHIQSAVQQISVVAASVESSSEVIKRLSEQSDTIGKFVQVITGISSQTNILALNAAIEASRVGEHGRGFAVVAEEVRKLAVQSNEAAIQIAELVESIQLETKQAVEAMQQGSVDVAQGVRSVQESGQIFASILHEMETVSTQISEVSAAAEQMSASSEQVSATITQLEHIADTSADNAQSVASASEEQLATMEEINAAATSLSAMVQELIELMEKFKT
ncbi:methyl-accepting chemotaxis protein [Paenibacillus abyssi]|nr:methyl-accepting chemotaxis protein [Paenibacillus abyssi]